MAGRCPAWGGPKFSDKSVTTLATESQRGYNLDSPFQPGNVRAINDLQRVPNHFTTASQRAKNRFGTEGCRFESCRVYHFHSENQGCHAGSLRVPRSAALLLLRKTLGFYWVYAIQRVSAIWNWPARRSDRHPISATRRQDYRSLAYRPRSKFILRLLRPMRTGQQKICSG